MLANLIPKKNNFYLSRSDYYNSIISENSFIEAIYSAEKGGNRKVLTSNNDILFNSGVPINTNYRDVIGEMGRPSFEIQKNKDFKHNVIFYKKVVANYRVRFEMHLVDDVFSIGFKTFDVSGETDKTKIVNSVFSKYEVESDLMDNVRIQNHTNNFVEILNTVNVTLAYGLDDYTNNEILFNLSSSRSKKESDRNRKEEIDLLRNV